MRVLLTGACGLLGSAVRRLGAAEHEFVPMDVVDTVTGLGGIYASIEDREAVFRAAEGCQAIIHTAAMHGAFRKTHSDHAFTAANVLGAQNLYDAARELGIRRLVMSSTMEVVVGRRWKAYGPGVVVDEDTPARPDWIYPVNKLQVEQLGRLYAEQDGLEVLQLRYMTIEANPAPVRLLARGVHVDDVARANLLALSRPVRGQAVLHIGPDTPLTQNDVNDAMDQPTTVLERHWPGCMAVLAENGVNVLPEDFWPVTLIERARAMLAWQPRDTFEGRLAAMGWRHT